MQVIKIIPKQCISCGICSVLFPEIFDYHDNGVIKFTYSDDDKLINDSQLDLTSVIKKCPTRAIIIEDISQ